MEKKKYLLVCNVVRAGGTQTWAVEAESEADAIARFRNGEGEVVENDVEVTELGEPEICE